MFDLVPFRRNSDLRKRGDDFFNNFVDTFFDNDLAPFNLSASNFRVDLKETDTDYVVEADIPGVEKDAINIDYDNSYLTISAKREDSVEDKKENYVRRERHYGEFRRSFYVDNIDENKIDASFKDGVLKVVLPKLEKGQTKKNRIEIH